MAVQIQKLFVSLGLGGEIYILLYKSVFLFIFMFTFLRTAVFFQV